MDQQKSEKVMSAQEVAAHTNRIEMMEQLDFLVRQMPDAASAEMAGKALDTIMSKMINMLSLPMVDSNLKERIFFCLEQLAHITAYNVENLTAEVVPPAEPKTKHQIIIEETAGGATEVTRVDDESCNRTEK